MTGGPWSMRGSSGTPIMQQLRRFMIAISWVSVNHDGRRYGS